MKSGYNLKNKTQNIFMLHLKPKTIKILILLYSVAFFVDSAVQLLIPGQQVSGTPHVFFHIFSGIALITVLRFFPSKINLALLIFGIGYMSLGIGAIIFPHTHNGYQSSIIGLDGDANTPLTHIGVSSVALILAFLTHFQKKIEI